MSDAPDGFEKTTIPLPATHNWQCKPGNNLFIAERGAVAFEIPREWAIHHDKKDTLTIHDKEPPADRARIFIRAPAAARPRRSRVIRPCASACSWDWAW